MSFDENANFTFYADEEIDESSPERAENKMQEGYVVD